MSTSEQERETQRSRSRSPLRSKSPINDKDTSQSKEAGSCMSIHVTNIPTHWSFKQITEFVRGKTGDKSEEGFFLINVIRDAEKNLTGECIFIFRNIKGCQKALKELDGAECEGKIIKAQLDIDGSIARSAVRFRKRKVNSEFTPKPGFSSAKNTSNVFTNTKVGYMPPEVLSDETYGLSQQCLNALDIQPPLRRKIFVQNLCKSVTEEQLYEVFSLAGQVTSVCMLTPNEGAADMRAMIEFDHPVEAVQAISMLNQRRLHDRPMYIRMDRKPNFKRRLPMGLESVGPGLGRNGEPMKGVRAAMELKPVKEKLENVEIAVHNKESSQINSDAGNTNSFQPNQPTQTNLLLTQLSALLSNQVANQGIANNVTNAMALQSPNVQNQGQNLPNFGQNYGTNAPNFGQNSSNFGQNIPNLEQNALNMNFTQPSVAMGQGASFNQTGQANMQQNIPNFNQNTVQNQNDWNTQSSNVSTMQSGQQYGADGSYCMQQPSFGGNGRDFDTKFQNNNMDIGNVRYDSNKGKSGLLVFSYLPPSVTGEALNIKMREIGELELAEVTGKGRAIVRFKNSIDAEKCIELFDRSKVDGQTINVKFL